MTFLHVRKSLFVFQQFSTSFKFKKALKLLQIFFMHNKLKRELKGCLYCEDFSNSWNRILPQTALKFNLEDFRIKPLSMMRTNVWYVKQSNKKSFRPAPKNSC